MKNITLFLLIIIFIILLYFTYNENNNEHLTLSNEAVQTISSVYNTGKVSVNNVIAENNISAVNEISGKTISANALTVNTIATSETSGNVSFTGGLTFGGSICAGNVCVSQEGFQKMIKYMSIKDNMYDGNATIYQNLYTAMSNNVIKQSGNASSWDSTSYSSAKWNGQLAINIGDNNQYPNGLTVNVPNGMTLLWVRIFNDRWACMALYNSSGTNLGVYASGFRNLNNTDPNGCATDANWGLHKWIPIPIPTVGTYVLVGVNINGNQGDNWISGIAFSTNPWNHAMNSAVAYHWGLNGGSSNFWNNQNWNNDQLAQINTGVTTTFYVPVVPSGNDKLVYIVEYNDNWVGTQHTSVTANGTAIERLKTTYMNPFATHHNSKAYMKYIAARIPSSLIKPTDTFVVIAVSMANNDNIIYFREIGTHDYL